MIRRLSTLLFLIGLYVALSTFAPSQLQARGGLDYCECFDGFGALYNIDPVYGPWSFVDQQDITTGSLLIEPEAQNALDICVFECYIYTRERARSLCNLYGFANHHWQVQFWYYFDDYGEDDGGSQIDLYDTGSAMQMCADYF